jgi:hypothetical protein
MGMRKMGVVEISVEAIPILAYLIATREEKDRKKIPRLKYKAPFYFSSCRL